MIFWYKHRFYNNRLVQRVHCKGIKTLPCKHRTFSLRRWLCHDWLQRYSIPLFFTYSTLYTEMPAGHQCVRKNILGYQVLQRDPDHGSHPRPNCRTGRFCWRVLSPQRLTCRQRDLYGCSGRTACLNAQGTRCPQTACQGPESCESGTRLLSLPSTWSQSSGIWSVVCACMFLQFGCTWKNIAILQSLYHPCKGKVCYLLCIAGQWQCFSVSSVISLLLTIFFLSRTLDFFSFFLSLWIYLWLAETSQQPISQTTWLKVTPPL